ncbi:hypothetical protein HMPREF9336_00964 [Segniliparus rugosus ATCC BAA-974]|uniref:MspA protein n=1 Tax=Segniliparus rugosus (strain ATCC BAA-974 / DSM 45345 / CCUG 50838 / CIP 108380 / JCM 13579 / CDC 945) TaxID=679197 RepID=E5XN94_SEGRC|nr:hypothetical protein HMPREF9336_00964 [Segniliparus rugosus ATCC BAA-974]
MGSWKHARGVRRALAGLTAGLSAWGAVLSSSGAAFADNTVDLPDDSITQTLPDGTAVTLSVRDQYAIISPAMVAVQTSRNMWANGTVRVDIEGHSDEGRITPGYIVGCQFTFGAQAGGSFNGGTGNTGTGLNAAAIGGALNAQNLQGVGTALGPVASSYLPSGSIGFSIGPGQAVDYPMLRIEEPDDYGNQTFDSYFAFAGNHGGISYTDVTFKVDGCAGYAQARPYTRVRIKNSKTMAFIMIWGPPSALADSGLEIRKKPARERRRSSARRAEDLLLFVSVGPWDQNEGSLFSGAAACRPPWADAAFVCAARRSRICSRSSISEGGASDSGISFVLRRSVSVLSGSTMKK